MRVIANLTFDEFVNEFEKEFQPSWECPLKAVIADQAFKLGKTFPKDWGDKDKKWKTWLKDAGFDFKSNVVTSINSANMSEMARGRGDEDRARAVYYALHRNVENLNYAHAVDDVMFDGPFLKSGRPVFEIAPDPIAPTAPFSHPQYHLYDSIKDKLRKSPEGGTWLDPHNHHSIPLSGRDAEQATLTQFMDSPEPFLILPLIAPSGAGKTRLISQWMRRYVPSASDTEWDAGFVDSTRQNSRDPQPWCYWEITRPTLIVIDYTFAYDAVVREIADRARRNPTQHKIRLLVIDHIYPKFLKEDLLWGKMFGSPGQLNLLERTKIIRPPLELEPENAGSRLLRDVISASASLGDKDFTADDSLIIEAEGHLTRMGETSDKETHGDPNAVRHPLFAALMGQAIRKAKGEAVDFSKWTRRDLITYYFSGENRLPWTVWDDTRGVSVGALVCAATLRRGLPIDGQMRRGLAKNADVIIDYAKRVVSSDTKFVIKPFLPDILGEAFLLLFLEFIENDEVACADFIALLFSEDADQEIAANFQETITRLARNLASENQAEIDITQSWRAICRFLDPESFEIGTQLRLAVSYSIAEVVHQLNDIRQFISGISDEPLQHDLPQYHIRLREINRNIYKLMGCFKIDEVAAVVRNGQPDRDISQPNIHSAIRSTLIYFDQLSDDDKKEKAELVILMCNHFLATERLEWPEHYVAAYFGNHVAYHFLKSMRENKVTSHSLTEIDALGIASARNHNILVRQMVSDGCVKTFQYGTFNDPLTIACSAGHLTIAKILVDAGASIDREGRHFAMKPFTGACRGGHLDVVEFLLSRGADPEATDSGSQTGFLLAAEQGHVDLLSYLAAENCNVGHVDVWGNTAITLACRAGKIKVLEFFFRSVESRGYEIPHRETDIAAACDSDNLGIVKLLVREGYSTSIENKAAFSALKLSAKYQRIHIFDYLLEENGLDPEFQLGGKQTVAEILRSWLSTSEKYEDEELKLIIRQWIDRRYIIQN